MQLSIPQLKNFLDYSLSEDLQNACDITSELLISNDKEVIFEIVANQDMMLCGVEIVRYFIDNYPPILELSCKTDGEHLEIGTKIMACKGSAKNILMLERTILNYLQHLSGISTLTREYVQRIKHTNARICDTRKTIPGLRIFQKYATKIGGAKNHRFNLGSSILIKDNHIAICGGIGPALNLAKTNKPHYMTIEIECDTINQVSEAIEHKADIIMLDNMDIEQICDAIKLINKRAIVEVSGGVNLENVASIAETGADYISIGRLTHSAPAIDISMNIL